MPTRLILASSSRYRQALLQRLGLDFDSLSPEIDESPLPQELPEALVVRLAKAKADKIAQDYPDAVIIGSDQVCVNQQQILGKPGSQENAEKQLAAASGQNLRFLTSLAVIGPHAATQTAVVTTTVQFRTLSKDAISRYIAKELPLDCAGSFKSEGLGVSLFESVSSNDLTALEGLPLIKTCEFLRAQGFVLP